MQEVISNDSSSNPQINYRISCNNWWSRWIKIATIDDIYNSSMVFRGDAPTNALSGCNLNGIYNLGGKVYSDWVDQSQLFGQLVVMNTGGVCNQTFYNNVSDAWTRTINSWGTTPWRRLDNL